MKAVISDITMNYGDIGTGLPVLLIHGFPLSSRMWAPQAEALSAAGYRVITPDLRGFGDSDAPEGPYSMELFADDLIALLDFLSIEQAVVGGMSMGGYVLLNLLERFPERVKAACFIVTRSTADDDAGKARRLTLAQDVMKFGPQVISDVFRPILFSAELIRDNSILVEEICRIILDTPSIGLAGGLLAMRERKDYSAMLSSFDKPSLIIGADRDLAMPLEHIRTLQAGLPNSTAEIISGGGHMVNLEKPDEFNRSLIGFLQSLN